MEARIGFETDLVVEELGGRLWKLRAPLIYHGAYEALEVPAGTETDFASVPRFLWSLIPTYGRYTKAAVLHDYLCDEAAEGRFSRCDADGLFRRSMNDLGVGYFRRHMMWAAVRWAGGILACPPIEAAKVLLISIIAVPLLLIPAVVSVIFLGLLWLIDLLLWNVGRRDEDRPTFLPRG